MSTARIHCTECQQEAGPLDWRCKACAGALELSGLPAFDAAAINTGDFSMWRYGAMFPVERRVSLGEGLTPLVRTTIDGSGFWAKLEYLNPTGSYKDRGTVTMMNHMLGQGVAEVVEDSSGNAGASVSAYASAMGIRARIFVPEAAAASKKALIRSFGGELVEVAGPQYAKTQACEEAARVTPYASHAWSPYFVLGQRSAAYEEWEQLGGAPDAVVTPLGHGGLFLGFWQGFQDLFAAGLIEKMPRMFGVQAEASDPIVRAWESGTESPDKGQSRPTVADGIMVDVPVRGKAVLAAIRQSGGAALRVSDPEILAARDSLAGRGLIAEPTSATTVAALPQVRQHLPGDARIVCALTGNGLKYVGR